VKKGEVVGLGGLVGAGRTELAKSVFGIRTLYGGTILFKGEQITHPTPSEMIRKGLIYLTEDRKEEGVILRMDIAQNITVASLHNVFPNRFLNYRKEDRIADETIQKFDIVCNSKYQTVNTLSGGNQQKVAFGKWIINEPDLLILDEPTRGIDVNAKSEIYKIIDNLAKEGKAVLMISSELPELIGMCDRIYVMRRGTISKELSDKEEFTQENILSYTV